MEQIAPEPKAPAPTLTELIQRVHDEDLFVSNLYQRYGMMDRRGFAPIRDEWLCSVTDGFKVWKTCVAKTPEGALGAALADALANRGAKAPASPDDQSMTDMGF